ncbi:MAG TPA: hypothetical protein VF189_05860 [Patescibacteria group bacterium]
MRKGNESELERRARIALKMAERQRHFAINMFIPARVDEPQALNKLRRMISKVTVKGLWSDDNFGEEIRVEDK